MVSELELLLGELSGQGRSDSRGIFTLKLERALELLARHRTREPESYVLHAVAAAVAGGARWIDVRVLNGRTVFVYEGHLLTAAERDWFLQSPLLPEAPAYLQELALMLGAGALRDGRRTTQFNPRWGGALGLPRPGPGRTCPSAGCQRPRSAAFVRGGARAVPGRSLVAQAVNWMGSTLRVPGSLRSLSGRVGSLGCGTRPTQSYAAAPGRIVSSELCARIAHNMCSFSEHMCSLLAHISPVLESSFDSELVAGELVCVVREFGGHVHDSAGHSCAGRACVRFSAAARPHRGLKPMVPRPFR